MTNGVGNRRKEYRHISDKDEKEVSEQVLRALQVASQELRCTTAWRMRA